MRAGELRLSLTIQTPTRAENSKGEVLVAYVDAGSFYASVEPLTSREINFARQAELSTTHRIRARYTPDLKSDCRLKFGTRIFDIVGIVNVEERNIELEISAVEVTRG